MTLDAGKLGFAALAVACAVILAALAFEHWGGHIPCPLCLQQRYAYYFGIPVLAAALVLLGIRTKASAALFAMAALAFLANAGLGVYQSGAEWGFWPGPLSCAGAQEISTSASDLLKGLNNTSVVRCDEASWRFAGLSFAGWNAVFSLFLASLGLFAAWRSWKP